MAKRLTTTVGQLLINEGLPEPLRDYNRVLDKAGAQGLLQKVYEYDPQQYPQIVDHLSNVGHQTAQLTGSSFALEDLETPPEVQRHRAQLARQAQQLAAAGQTSELVKLLSDSGRHLQNLTYEAARKRGNPFADQVLSGSRGNKAQLQSMLAGDVANLDDKDDLIPFPVLHSYAEGLDPAEYWAGAYGSRKALLGTKISTQDAGAWGKQVSMAVHRLIASDALPDPSRAVPLSTSDVDLPGYVLARDVGKFKAGSIITDEMAERLRDSVDEVLVYSPLAAGSFLGGIPRMAFGVRERGTFPRNGDAVGMLAAQAIAERLSQMSLGSKHGGGIVGSRGGVSGFKLINNLVQVPKSFAGGAAVAQLAGTVRAVTPASQGGHNVLVGDQVHYIAPELQPTVQPGDRVEAGDVLSDGYPNPAEIVRHKGIGEGRRQFTELFMRALRESGVAHHRRNVEVLARGLINHVRVTGDDLPGYLPGDLAEYDTLEENWEPRDGAVETQPSRAVGRYLERPVLWYTIGTPITGTVAAQLKKYGVDSVLSHPDPAPFEPEMLRALENLSASPDPLVRLSGTYLERGLLEATHRGRVSDLKGTSPLPAILAGEL